MTKNNVKYFSIVMGKAIIVSGSSNVSSKS